MASKRGFEKHSLGVAYPCDAEGKTTCIRESFLCDHVADCPNKRDEDPKICGFSDEVILCDETEHWNPSTKRCEKVSHDTCSVAFFPCSQICQITKSKPLCSCADRYKSTSDNPYGCVPDSDQEAFVLFNNQKTVKGFTLTNSELSAKLSSAKTPSIYSSGHSNTVGLDYNLKTNTIYWSAVASSASRKESHVNHVQLPDLMDYRKSSTFDVQNPSKLMAPLVVAYLFLAQSAYFIY